MANSFGARSCRVRVDKPRRIWLDFVHADPLAPPVRVPAVAEPGAGLDLARVSIGRAETGRPWMLRLLDRHILVAGVSDAGKSSVMWAVLRALAPWIRCGLVQVAGIDPKGGMELGRAPGVFQKLVCSNGAEAVELLEHVATLTRQRAATLRTLGWDEVDLNRAAVDVCWRLVRRKGAGLLRLPSTKSGESGERLIRCRAGP